MQGPAELLPVSSSGHLVLVPELLGWPYARLDADVRKTFEVALHAGAGLALAWLMRDAVVEDLRDPVGTLLLAAPASAFALLAESWIETRASGARIAALAQIGAGAALAAIDGTASAKGWRVRRDREVAVTRAIRGLPQSRVELALIGVAQAAALVPGVSRNGATMTAARVLGYPRAEAARLSWRAGLPVIGGAVVLKSARIAQRGLDSSLRRPFAAGAAAAFASTLASARLARLAERPWLPLGAYRVALGAIALRRLHRLQWPRG